jgi:AraC-like DNA-binding protein
MKLLRRDERAAEQRGPQPEQDDPKLGEPAPMSMTTAGSLSCTMLPERHLLRAKDLVDARFGEPLDVPALARAAYLSPAHFSREFRRVFGETPHQYLLTRRLERAAALLRSTDRPVTEICFTVGLRSVGSFTTSFRRVYGMSPAAYRAAHPPRERARIPTCVLQAYARPHSSSFREDTNAA